MARRTGRNTRKSGRKENATKEYRARSRTAPGGSLFLPDFPDQVKAIAMRGLSDDEMAAVFGISEETFQAWKAYYPSFKEAIAKGRTFADARVVQALFDNAVGYDYETDEIVKYKEDYDIVTVKKRKLGETNAQKYWLSNRQPDNWGEKLQVGGDRSPGAAPIGVREETKSEVINSILNLITPKPNP